MYYLYNENKGADQLHSYCAADLRLFFAYMYVLGLQCLIICQKLGYVCF